jgi:hypothetical protein
MSWKSSIHISSRTIAKRASFVLEFLPVFTTEGSLYEGCIHLVERTLHILAHLAFSAKTDRRSPRAPAPKLLRKIHQADSQDR